MSFIDLATWSLHRRNQMEERIKVFTSKCDKVSKHLEKLKLQTQNFVHELNCDPSELKERFLSCMRTLDEYIYFITDIDLSIGKFEETIGSVEYTPVQDNSMKNILMPTQEFNIIDVLSEPTPSTSRACPNLCPLEHKPKPKKIPKDEQTLIVFSSTSCSSESMPIKSDVEKKEQEVQCQLTEEINKMTLKDTRSPTGPVPKEPSNLPAQMVLEMEQIYPATIMNVDGTSLWVITEDPDEAFKLMIDMTSFYKANSIKLSLEEITNLTYCAYYDEESDCYYRAYFIGLVKEDVSIAEVFLVDTGEMRCGPASQTLQPLVARFCSQPPYARCCHLAGVDMSYTTKEFADRQEQFLRQYLGTHCTIEVDDNTSESLGVYVMLSDTEILNEMIINEGLASSSEKPTSSTPAPSSIGPPELGAALDELDMEDCPEYEDPVEAVTGYSCRDEAEICKHYKGGPEKTCFKGPRCKKRHVLMHPDGWTLDRVEVAGKCPSLPLPAPGTWHRAVVTCVAHFDRLYVQLTQDRQTEEDTLPDFGVILPPKTLEALIRDMNSPASRMSYKPLKIMPAVGELVAALYPPDDQWYRARVLSVTRADQNLEVMYIDYGNVVWVREDKIRALEPRHTVLPAQAIRCALGGVGAKGHDSRLWAQAKQRLHDIAADRTVDMHVVARSYDEITVEMFDETGCSLAERLAALNLVTLTEFAVVDDSTLTKQIVVP